MTKKAEVIKLTNDDVKTSNVFNALISTLRSKLGAALYGESPDGKRDYNALFGYPDNPSYSDFMGIYRRGGIAHTVVAKVAKACWRDTPAIKVNDNKILEDTIKSLKKAGLFSALERADILNRIGKTSILFIGVQDGENLDKPIGAGGNIEDLYFNVYGEDGITILEKNNDPMDKRFGLPVIYQLQINSLESGSTGQIRTVKVHYSRVVHLAEGALEDPLEGCSALEPVYNALLDKDKVRGSSSEAFFRNARQKFALTANEGAKIDSSTTGTSTLTDEVEAFTNNQQDFMRLNKMTANVMQPQIASPRDSYDVCVEEIAGQTGIPVRILTTKAGGVVSGTEDKASWNALVNDRQDSQCSNWFIQSIEILENAKVIDTLPIGYDIEWPEQSALSEKENAEVNDLKAGTIQKVSAARSVQGGDELELESILKELDLENIKIDDTVPTGIIEDDITL